MFGNALPVCVADTIADTVAVQVGGVLDGGTLSSDDDETGRITNKGKSLVRNSRLVRGLLDHELFLEHHRDHGLVSGINSEYA